MEGLGNRAKATLIVSRGDADELVRIDRQGEATVIIPAARLISARRGAGHGRQVRRRQPALVLQWRAEDGDIYETGFLPRYKADVDTRRVRPVVAHRRGPRPTPRPDRAPRRPSRRGPTSPATEGNDDIMSTAARFDLGPR